MTQLSELGVEVSIDDFGAGVTSLASLEDRLAVDAELAPAGEPVS